MLAMAVVRVLVVHRGAVRVVVVARVARIVVVVGSVAAHHPAVVG